MAGVITFGDLKFPSDDGNEEVKFFLKFHCIKFSNKRTIRSKRSAPEHGTITLPMPPNMLTQTATTFMRDSSVESGLSEFLNKTGASRGILGGIGAGIAQITEPFKAFPQTMMDAAEMVFSGTNQRLFQFNYQLVAKNYGEARVINEISKVFEAFSLPSDSGETFRMNHPPNWYWDAQGTNGQTLPADAWLGSPSLTFLQNISVDRTSSGGVYAISGEGGVPLPMSVSIGVQFVEMEPVMLGKNRQIQPRSAIIAGNIPAAAPAAEGG